MAELTTDLSFYRPKKGMSTGLDKMEHYKVVGEFRILGLRTAHAVRNPKIRELHFNAPR
jgi:hypothetical protein